MVAREVERLRACVPEQGVRDPSPLVKSGVRKPNESGKWSALPLVKQIYV